MFLPSQVGLGIPPLVGTMGSAQIEHAAAVIVRSCQVLGDAWKPVTIEDVGRICTDDVASGREPLTSLARNPFFRPDFWKLIERGYARWLGEPGSSAIELTEQGIKALERWVLKEPTA